MGWTAVVIAAITAAVTVAAGLFASWVAKPDWAVRHPRWVWGGVVGLAVIGVAITFVVVPVGNPKDGSAPSATPSTAPPSSTSGASADPSPAPGGGPIDLPVGGSGGGSGPPPGGGGGGLQPPPDDPVAALRITTAKLTTVRVGEPWSMTFTASGGTPAYRWALASGSVPPRFVLQQKSGELGGTLLTTDTYSFTVQVTDTGGRSATGSFRITPVPRRSDLNKDGPVGCQDKKILLDRWNEQGQDLPEDLNHDGTVNITDLSMLLSDWTGDSTTCD